MKLIYSIILIYLSNPLLSQERIEAYNVANEAEFLYENGFFEKALLKLEEGTKKNNFLTFKGIQIYFYIKNEKKDTTGTYAAFMAFQNTQPSLSEYFLKWKQGLNLLPELKLPKPKTEFKTKPVEVINFIEHLYQLDQSARKKSFGDQKIEDSYIAEQDSIIFIKLDSLIEKNKTVFRNTYSFDYNLFSIFLHMRHDRIDKLKPLLDTMLNNGQIDPFYYANIIDRQQIQQDNCPTYWEYTIGYPKSCEFDLEKCKSARKSIGLSAHYQFNYAGFYRKKPKPLLDNFKP